MIQYSRSDLFKIGEDLAVKHLVSTGYTLVCRNYRQTYGEIDVIVEKNQRLIFCEVKTRSYHSISRALEAVSFSKQKKLTKTAQSYINQNPQFHNHQFQFDIIVVLFEPGLDIFSVKHFEDAFLPVPYC